ncbi:MULTISPECIES: NfeD family protein [Pseudomonas]|uniref:NfeD family protein n=1 Tax=Pseudomonas quercus TaxID=2722792 RepID=A0ABX0YER6_9PSED|nr:MULTISPECIES: NfeD family protein [Pseudomonas]MBF7142171.1 NfeD family protein [Pseudomonas sp. LY10J]NJP00709.1 NfeD family protein [Pseudomonas quercus]
MDIQWWYWAVAGVTLILLELLLTSFFIVWFGLGALLVALLLWLIPALGIGTQLAAWGIASVALTLLWFRVFRAGLQRGPQWSADDALGEIGLLTVQVNAFQRGKVRFQKPLMGAEEWPCLANTHIPAGERVRVLAVEGNLVRVGPAGEA